MLVSHPLLLSFPLPVLQAKHAFLTEPSMWGRPLSELERFPQALTYSLHYLRARAGFLKLHGNLDKGKLHRLLRGS